MCWMRMGVVTDSFFSFSKSCFGASIFSFTFFSFRLAPAPTITNMIPNAQKKHKISIQQKSYRNASDAFVSMEPFCSCSVGVRSDLV